MFRICSAVDTFGRRQCVSVWRSMMDWHRHGVFSNPAGVIGTPRQVAWMSDRIIDGNSEPGGVIYLDQAEPELGRNVVSQMAIVHCNREGVDRFVFFCRYGAYCQSLTELQYALTFSAGLPEEILAAHVLAILHHPQPFTDDTAQWLSGTMSHFNNFADREYASMEAACWLAMQSFVARQMPEERLRPDVLRPGAISPSRIENALRLLPSRDLVETITRPGFNHPSPFDELDRRPVAGGLIEPINIQSRFGTRVPRLPAVRRADGEPCFKDY